MSDATTLCTSFVRVASPDCHRNLVTDEMVHERPRGYVTSSSDDDSDADAGGDTSMSEAGNSDADSGSSYETDSDA